MTTRFDRRKLLCGAGGSLLAIPLLESLMPRAAFAAPVAPKRFVIFRHSMGRLVGGRPDSNNVVPDRWSPMATTGPLPVGLSPLLAPLEPIRNEVVTVDSVDNIVRHLATGQAAADGHHFPTLTHLNCLLPKPDDTGGGPTIDYVVGSRLRANAAMPASLILNGDTGQGGETGRFWGENGTPPNEVALDGDLAGAIAKIFTGTTATPPATLTLKDRIVGARSSILDRVYSDYSSVRAKVSTTDQRRLDQHMTFIREAQTRYNTANLSMPTSGCMPVNPNTLPAACGDLSRLNECAPSAVDAIVQALSCDVTRSIALDYATDAYTFDWMFPNGSPFAADGWHAEVHGSDDLTSAQAAAVQKSFGFFASTFTLLVQKLAAVTDIDGKRLLDNTLVLWTSEMGYGSTHGCFNHPIVLAGMKSAFPKGQGRHVVPPNRASLGDLFAQILRIFGGTETTFGLTGTLQSASGSAGLPCNDGTEICAGLGYPGFITPDTPLHLGPLDL
jgi:hypothetical protein